MRFLKYTLAGLAAGSLLVASGCEQQGDSFEDQATTQASNAETPALGAGGENAAQPQAVTNAEEAPIAQTDANPPGPSMEGTMSLPNLIAQREYLSVPQKGSFDAAFLLFGNMKMERDGVQSRTTGEMLNKSQYDLSDLMIVATFHRQDGSFVNKALAYPDLDTLAPGESSTFEIFGDWDDDIRNVRLVVREYATENRVPSFMMPKINPNR